MADQEFRDMAWLVRPHVPGVPDIMLYYHLADAVRRHLATSLAWQYSLPNPVDLNAATAWPTLVEGTDYPTNTYVVQPTLLKWEDGQIIWFRTRDRLDIIDAKWEQDQSGSKPRYWTAKAPGDWTIYPQLAQNSTASLYMRVAIAPVIHKATAATGIEENLSYEYRDAWARGALATLLAVPGKDWSNIPLAKEYENMFSTDIKKAKSRVAADYGRPDRRVEYGGLPIGSSRRYRRANDYGKYYEL